MRLALEQLDTQRLVFELPPAHDGLPVRKVQAVVNGLAGTLESALVGFTISGLTARSLALEALCWTFGRLELTTERQALLESASGEITKSAAGLQLSLALARLELPELTLGIHGLTASARVVAERLTLQHGPSGGALKAERATFYGFALSTPTLSLSVPELSVTELSIGWGEGPVALAAGSLAAPELRLETGGVVLRGLGAEVFALQSQGAHVSLGKARLEQAEVEAPLAAKPRSKPRLEPGSARPRIALDWRLLDALAGNISADVEVDMTVPILGRRRATHELRLTVEEGAINYLDLEHGLSRLEDSLIDFSLREGKLVLERGLPLLATRGRGKPLVIWDLGETDHALAQQSRVRLSVLPSYRLPATDDDPDERKAEDKPFALRKLTVLNTQVFVCMLQNVPGITGAISELTFAGLTLTGQLNHSAEQALPGQMRLEGSKLRAVLRQLPIAGRAAEGRFEVDGMRSIVVSFDGLRPRALTASLMGVSLSSFELA